MSTGKIIEVNVSAIRLPSAMNKLCERLKEGDRLVDELARREAIRFAQRLDEEMRA